MFIGAFFALYQHDSLVILAYTMFIQLHNTQQSLMLFGEFDFYEMHPYPWHQACLFYFFVSFPSSNSIAWVNIQICNIYVQNIMPLC